MRHLVLRTFTGVLALLAASACTTTATTRIVLDSTGPTGDPLRLKAHDTLVAMVISKDAYTRASGEQAMVTALAGRGLEVVPAFKILTIEDALKQESATAALRRSGAIAALAVRPFQTTPQATYAPAYFVQPYATWTPFYGYAWGVAYTPGPYPADTVFRLEVLLYDLRTDKLVWAGQSSTTSPETLNGYIEAVVTAAVAELTTAGIFPPAP